MLRPAFHHAGTGRARCGQTGRQCPLLLSVPCHHPGTAVGSPLSPGVGGILLRLLVRWELCLRGTADDGQRASLLARRPSGQALPEHPPTASPSPRGHPGERGPTLGGQHPPTAGGGGGAWVCGEGRRTGRDFFLRDKVGGVRGCQLAMGYISTDKALPCRCEEFQLNIQPICLCVGEGLLCRRKASHSAQ